MEKKEAKTKKKVVDVKEEGKDFQLCSTSEETKKKDEQQ